MGNQIYAFHRIYATLGASATSHHAFTGIAVDFQLGSPHEGATNGVGVGVAALAAHLGAAERMGCQVDAGAVSG